MAEDRQLLPQENPDLVKDEHIWVLSNRKDNRVVLWERDAAHPGGEAYIAGSAPAPVGKTGEVARLLREGQLIEVPEPKDGPKKPRILEAVSPEAAAAMPGQTTPLGRKPDPELFSDSEVDRIEKVQEKLPDEVAVPQGVVVPPEPEPERARSRR